MAKLGIGVRVKMVRGMDIGNTGIIVGGSDETHPNEVFVRWDRAGWCSVMGIIRTHAAHEEVWAFRDDLEPIIPDGAKAGSWNTLREIWTPDKILETVKVRRDDEAD